MMVDRGAVLSSMVTLRPEDFLRPQHQAIARSIYAMEQRDVLVDAVTLTDELRRRGDLERVGGQVYLALLLDHAVTAANAEYHAAIVLEKSQMRRVLALHETLSDGAKRGKRAPELIEEAERELFDIQRHSERSQFQSLADALPPVLDAIERRIADKRDVTGIATGFTQLDRMTLGMQRRELAVVAARPSVGKSAFALNVAEKAARAGHRTLFVSLEMTKQALVERLLSGASGVDHQTIRSGFLGDQQIDAVTEAASRLAQLPLELDDGSRQSVFAIRQKVRRRIAEAGVDLVVIDYLQIVDVLDRLESRPREVALIANGLKQLAKDSGVAVLALAQIKRPPHGYEKRRPVLSDLKESGGIEEIADLVILLHRPELNATSDEERRKFAGLAEVIVAKQRNGPVGFVNMAFLKQTVQFQGLVKGPLDEEPPEAQASEAYGVEPPGED